MHGEFVKIHPFIDLAHTSMNYEPFPALVSDLVVESEKTMAISTVLIILRR